MCTLKRYSSKAEAQCIDVSKRKAGAQLHLQEAYSYAFYKGGRYQCKRTVAFTRSIHFCYFPWAAK